MEFKYNLTKKDYKKIIYEMNKHSNIFWIIVLSVIFFITTRDLILNNTLILFIMYVIYVFTMLLLFFIIDKLITILLVKINEKKLKIKYGTYTCEVDDEKIIDKIDDYKQEVYFKDIRKIIYKKNGIYIIQKNKNIFLHFSRSLFEKNEDFDKLKQILKERVIITK